jgi:hypothetical protein
VDDRRVPAHVLRNNIRARIGKAIHPKVQEPKARVVD